MSRLDVMVQICLAGVFSATLITLVFDFVMNTVNMNCQIYLLIKMFSTFTASKCFSKMLISGVTIASFLRFKT